ncbi:MAG TPA: acyl carrier protein [Longimicrobiales bacterium]|nr:acyl carrier protein [Longimicrobiales bacterium]
MEATVRTVKDYILEQFLPGESPDKLTNTTPLFTSGLLDSIASLQLVTFLEQEFGIKVSAHEVVPDNLNTLDSIAGFIRSKQS